MDAKQFAKDNWPLLAGGAIGLFLILRMRGGGGGAPAPVIMNAGPSEASVMASAQMEIARANQAFQARQLDSQIGLANRQLDAQMANAANEMAVQKQAIQAQVESNAANARVATIGAAGNFLQAQGVAAMGAGAAVSGMIGELNKPAIAAMMATAEENAAAMQAGAIAAVGSYQAQADAMKGVTNVLSEFLKVPQYGMQGVGLAMQGERQKGPLEGVIDNFLKSGGGNATMQGLMR